MPVSSDPAASAVYGQLTSRAETLEERLARLAEPSQAAVSPPAEAPRQLLTPWAKAFARGRFEALERRLAWDGWTGAQAAAAFRRADSLPAVSPAPWTAELERYVELAATAAARGAPDPDSEIPFVELWRPWVRAAVAGLDEDCLSPPWIPPGGHCPPGGIKGGRHHTAGLPYLLPAARADLESHLLAEIARLSELAAYELFDARRGGNESRRVYRDFIAECLEDPLGRLYTVFPVLARQSAETVRQWRAAVLELDRRLGEDRTALAKVFGGGRPIGGVHSVGAGLSDRHGGGRQVLRLELESGLALVYKPRGVDLELALGRWFGWCAGRGFELAPRAPRVLARRGYGWVEMIEQEEAANAGEAALYYRHAGALVTFAYVLGAEDLHAENVVATRDGPVIIDAEMFLQPERLRFSTHPEAEDARAGRSCLASGLLLHPGRGDRGRRREWGGLRPEPQRRWASGRRWRHVNSDRMSFEPEEARGELGANVLRRGAEVTRPEDYRREIADGFATAYRFLLEHRSSILAADGPLDFFRDAEVRVLLRPSQEYGTVLTLMSVPRNQRSGLKTSLLYEAMLRPFSDSDDPPLIWPLVADERAALVARDVPRFTVPLGGSRGEDTVPADEMPAEEAAAAVIGTAGLQATRERMIEFGEADLTYQLDLVHRALDEPERLACLGRFKASGDPESWRDLALDLGAELLAWNPAERLPGEAWNLRRGRAGIALFFAALAHQGGGAKFARAARELIEPIAAGLGSSTVPADLGLGGFSGLGSVVYTCTWLARLTDDPSYLETARRAAERIDAEAIAQDRAFDLERGVAGAVLGLLTFHEASGESAALELARNAGRHLLEQQEIQGSTGAAWRNTGGLMLAGWAHGAAGIVRALAALGEKENGGYRVAVNAALAYERSLYDPERRNWPLLAQVSSVDSPGVEKSRRVWTHAWCHGAPGIALGRMMLPPRFHDAVTRAEIEAALGTTAAAAPNTLDHLCCGTLGRAAVLLAAHQRAGSSEALAAARRLSTEVLDRAATNGGFQSRRDALKDRAFEPGFLFGLAGIGYHLLRAAGAGELPDVLALELPDELAARLEKGS